ncbi:MAG: hypothetical protein MUE40_04980 [Anaerolineae bacterium]|jgi:predicted flap endonuclease-1-like 5' DNA nuclease|nr:hypothetical protein [Anaerolineae bacterium]
MNDYVLSGLLLCYGPLALTIIGFVVFAAITDAGVTRTYLRRLDLRPESEQPELPEPLVKVRTVARTPSGMRVTLIPGEGGGSTQVMAEGTPAPVAPEKPAPKAVAAGDDLTVIEGIGPKMAAALNAAGLNTYDKVASSTEDALRGAIEAAGMRLSPTLSTWPAQARLAAAGQWDELKRFQAELGRKPGAS